MEKRKYIKTRRAQSQEQTRQKIVEAAAALHQELGPRATTITAVADRAGVQRLTVYRHFTDETALFHACTSHWLNLNPLPDTALWASVRDPLERCRTAFAAFYAYYRNTASMWEMSYRDVGEVSALQEPMARFEGMLDAVCDDLTEFWGARGGKFPLIKPTIGHALRFSTWRSLEAEGLDDDAKADAAARWLSAAASADDRGR